MTRPRQTLRLFEYQRLRLGDEVLTVEGQPLVIDQMLLDKLSRFNASSGGRFFQQGHRSIRATQHVGIVQVGNLGLELLPKVGGVAATSEGAAWRDALVRMLRVAGVLPSHVLEAANQDTQRQAHLLDIYIDHLVSAAETLLNHGLAKGYGQVSENQRVYRGRLVIGRHLQLNAARPDRFFMTHSVYGYDTPLNRLLKAALTAVAKVCPNLSLQARAKRALKRFPDVENLASRIDLTSFDRLRLNRQTERYATVLPLARLVLLGHSPSIRWGDQSLVAILLDMNLLFEQFIAQMFRRAKPAHIRVWSQLSRNFWPAEAQEPRRLRPDIVLENQKTGEVVVLDTKWKVPRGRPALADVKQMYIYNEYFDSQRSILLYPRASSDQAVHSGSFIGRDHRCETGFIELFRDGRLDLGHVEKQLAGFCHDYFR